jgi:PIN domain nuclease of toxin-antitoxin system
MRDRIKLLAGWDDPITDLLDTTVALIALSSPERLSPALGEALARGPHYVSVLTYWEVVIKTAIGKLDVGEPRLWWHEAVENLAARILPVRPEHVAALCDLPPIHKDPFDRLLIAQAIASDLILVTTNREIQKYASGRFRVLS